MSDIWDATTRSRHNIPIEEVEWMEHVANRGIVYEEGENFIRLNFTIHNPDEPHLQYACFYLNGEHFDWMSFKVSDRPVKAQNDDTEETEEDEEPLSAA